MNEDGGKREKLGDLFMDKLGCLFDGYHGRAWWMGKHMSLSTIAMLATLPLLCNGGVLCRLRSSINSLAPPLRTGFWGLFRTIMVCLVLAMIFVPTVNAIIMTTINLLDFSLIIFMHPDAIWAQFIQNT